jgi:hypothetical protein
LVSSNASGKAIRQGLREKHRARYWLARAPWICPRDAPGWHANLLYAACPENYDLIGHFHCFGLIVRHKHGVDPQILLEPTDLKAHLGA